MSSVYQIPLTHRPFTGGPTGNSYNVAIQVAPGAPVTGPVHSCQVDTGSCGMVVPVAILYEGGMAGGKLLPGVTQGAPITIHYQPSQNSLEGFLYTIDELAIGVDPTTNVPAFIARNVTVVGSTNAKPGEGMMGVGFGRPTQFGTNVFLTAPDANPSYLLTTEGIWLGYTPATLPNANQFGFESLVPVSPSGVANNTPDWQAPAVKITLTPSSSGPVTYSGNALLDTGVTLMMLGVDHALTPADLINSTVQITWPGNGATPILSYNFKITNAATDLVPENQYNVAGATLKTPKSFIPLGPKTPAFVNTGINVIQGADFYFDATTGCIGFRPRSAAS